MAKTPSTETETAPEADAGTMMLAERIYIISAPGGSRRRGGHGFGPEPCEMRWEDFGEDPEAVLDALRADPMIKIDGRFEDRPVETSAEEKQFQRDGPAVRSPGS